MPTFATKLKELVRGKQGLAAHATKSFSVYLACGDRVKRRDTGMVGTVIQVQPVNAEFKIPCISVKHIDGAISWLVPAEEYTKWTGRY